MAHASKSPRTASQHTTSRTSTRSPGSSSPRSTPSLFKTLQTPGHARSQLLRRLAGVALLLAALFVAASGLRDNPQVLVFARDVGAGQELRAEDVHTIRVPQDAIPTHGAIATADDVVGRVVTSPAVAGEFVTELRLLGDELTSNLVPDGHMVPLKLAEPDLVSLLHHGDTVNVVTSWEDGHSPGLFAPGVVAEHARVIATSADITSGSGNSGRAGAGASATILIALPAEQAQVVASASLSQPLTVVITGERTNIQQKSRRLGSTCRNSLNFDTSRT